MNRWTDPCQLPIRAHSGRGSEEKSPLGARRTLQAAWLWGKASNCHHHSSQTQRTPPQVSTLLSTPISAAATAQLWNFCHSPGETHTTKSYFTLQCYNKSHVTATMNLLPVGFIMIQARVPSSDLLVEVHVRRLGTLEWLIGFNLISHLKQFIHAISSAFCLLTPVSWSHWRILTSHLCLLPQNKSTGAINNATDVGWLTYIMSLKFRLDDKLSCHFLRENPKCSVK